MAFISFSNGQLLKKMKEKIDKAVGTNNSGNNNTTTPASPPADPTNPGNTNQSNKTGQGLITTPPDVKENLSSAEASFKTKNYGESRYAVQQAILGIELEIGKQILKGLPSAVNTLQKDSLVDQVTSTGWGWAGLTIQRVYKDNDKEFKVTIANNNAWMQALNLYLSNSAYAQTSAGQQKMKQVKVKGIRSVIEFDENSGYKVSIPLGQSSLIVFEGVNFATEQDMMKAVNLFDIEGIKNTLGEK
jgi:hypothetical protein